MYLVPCKRNPAVMNLCKLIWFRWLFWVNIMAFFKISLGLILIKVSKGCCPLLCYPCYFQGGLPNRYTCALVYIFSYLFIHNRLFYWLIWCCWILLHPQFVFFILLWLCFENIHWESNKPNMCTNLPIGQLLYGYCMCVSVRMWHPAFWKLCEEHVGIKWSIILQLRGFFLSTQIDWPIQISTI